MSRPLQSSLKALAAAVTKLKDDNATNAMEIGTNLVEVIKPGDALNAERAQILVSFFDVEIGILYSLLPQLTIKFSTVYFADLIRLFKAEQVQQLWQYVAGKGILTGLLAFVQSDEAGPTTHFEKNFIAALCQLLNSSSSSSKSRLTTDLRRCVGSFLAGITAKDERAKKWMLEPKVLGIVGLSDLIVKETEFRVLDACLEIATRLAPKRSDPQARRAFFADVFNSTSAKANFGEDACKRLMRVVEQPIKGRTWFEIADQMFSEMGGHADRLQRFVMDHLIISGQTFSGKNTSLRLYVDTEMTFNAFLLDEDDEMMITTSYDNLIEVQIDYKAGVASAKLSLKSPPYWDNPDELSSQASSPLISLQLSVTEMARFQKILKLRGQASKIFDSAKPTKQSFSLHPTALSKSNPSAPPILQAKLQILKSFVPSPTPIEDTLTSGNQLKASKKGSTRVDSDRHVETMPEVYEIASTPPVTQPPPLSPPARSVVRETKNRVRRGVIFDSDDYLGEQPPTTSVPSLGSKRKASISIETGDEVLSTEPARKKLHVESTNAEVKPSSVGRSLLDAPNTHKQKAIMKHSNQKKSPALDNSIKINKQHRARTPAISVISSKPQETALPQTHSRINGMRAKDGTRPAAASTPPRRGQTVKIDIPRSIQEPSQRNAKGNSEATFATQAATLPTWRAKKLANKPEKAIWEAEDFNQKAVLLFAPMDPGVNGKLAVAEVVDEDDAGNEEIYVENEAEVISLPDVGPAVVEVIPQTPSPLKVVHKLYKPVQDDETSSPIRPAMALKRKLRDADTLSQRLRMEIAKPVGVERSPAQRPEDLKVMSRSPQKEAAPDEYRRKVQTNSLRSFVPKNDGHKRRPIINWAVPINPSRPRPITGPRDAKKPEVERPSKVTRSIKKGNKNADKKSPKYRLLPPPVAPDDDSDSEFEQEVASSPPLKSEVDEIAEVLSAIQNTILDNIQGKFSGVRREARLARANLLENAVADLEVMQENHDKSFARFVRLEEKCGEVMQDIIGALEEVDMHNQEIIANLNAIIREHDKVATAFRAARKPLFPKLPLCLEI